MKRPATNGDDLWPAGRGGRSPTILVAEAEQEIRGLLERLVRKMGYGAVTVSDGEAALAAVAADPPDLVLSAVSIPGMNGVELCRRLKADPATQLIPVVLMTAVGPRHKTEGIEAGADEFLAKPFSAEELQTRIRTVLRMKAILDELDHAEAVLCAMGRRLEARDPYTGGHCERLADYAVALGRVLGAGDKALGALRRGSYLHDLGKVAVPDAILLKNGPLTPEERWVMERHPAVGEEICRPLRSFEAVLPIIRYHHERWDGSGYPDGLKEWTIPVTARILQTVDIYDALISDRPHRRGWSPAD